MNKVKCECGHVNPEGTVLCEACGKPIEGNQHIDGNDKTDLINMRYEGSSRRSLVYNKSIVDKIWSFFSSVKVGVWLIVLALVGSAIGSIFPQEIYIPEGAISRDPSIFYEARYGLLGKIYYQLGFHHLYSSWWYMLLLGLIGVSLVICSLDRFLPLHRALKRQKPKRHHKFLSRQRLYSESENISTEEFNTVKARLKKQRYKIYEENGHVLAEKGRFSRWGPYVNHIGLIIVLLAAILRLTPLLYTDEYMWIREGEELPIPGTDGEYYLENKEFILETHDEEDERFKGAIEKQGGMVPSNFQTNAVLYKATDTNVPGAEPELKKEEETSIRLNQPLKFGGFSLYQAGYQLNEFKNMTFNIYAIDDENQQTLDQFTVELDDPESTYQLENGFTVKLEEYFPEYVMKDGVPRSESKYPKNPAFVFAVTPPDEDKVETSFIGIGKNIDPTEENKYKIGIEQYEARDVSGLTVRQDYTLPVFAFGGLIFMIGVVQGMYWQHRRIWLHPTKDGLLLAAHTNKNWFGIEKEIEKAINDTHINMVEDQKELDE